MSRRNPDPIPLPVVASPEISTSCKLVRIDGSRSGRSVVHCLLVVDGSIGVPFSAPEEVARRYLARLGLDLDAAWVEHESMRLLDAAGSTT